MMQYKTLTQKNHFIAVDMDSGYWQVVTEEETPKILAFFDIERNWRCKVLPMGALNTAPSFVAIMMNLYMKCDTLAK